MSKGLVMVWTALRIVVGVIFIAHGFQKLSDPGATQQAFAGIGFGAPEVAVWLAIAGEFLGGIGLLLGFLTRIAALGPLIVMLVAIFAVHLPNGLFAANGGFEYPLVLLFTLAFYAVAGAGPVSVDALLSDKGKLFRQPFTREASAT